MNSIYSKDKPVIIWLLSGCFLVFCMVVIGGITRLTGSGLSITEWKPIMGAVPPLNEDQWNEAFEKYKQIPQFKLENYNFTLNDFKMIFFWEWLHRFIGRVIGIVFIVPFAYWGWKGRFSKPLVKKLQIILVLGAFQGFLGWFMVKSGLSELTSVSHYRLAAHLITAFATFGYIWWVALDLIYPKQNTIDKNKQVLVKLVKFGFVLVILQIIYGAFVAGLDAGLIYNTWPKMNDEWIASNAFSLDPWWTNLLSHKDGVQLIHRYLAYVVAAVVIYVFIKGNYEEITKLQKGALQILLGTVVLQFILGVLTLVYSVPIVLGVLHQTGAFFLFGAFIYLLHVLKVAESKMH